MEAIKKLPVVLLVTAGLLIFLNKVSAQTTYNTSPVTAPSPNHDVLYGKTPHTR